MLASAARSVAIPCHLPLLLQRVCKHPWRYRAPHGCWVCQEEALHPPAASQPAGPHAQPAPTPHPAEAPRRRQRLKWACIWRLTGCRQRPSD